MSLSQQLADFATRAATEDKSIRTLLNGNEETLQALTTTAKSTIVAALNEVNAKAENGGGGGGGATVLDQLLDVAITSPASGHILRHNGTEWVNVVGSAEFDVAGSAAAAEQAAIEVSQPLDSDLTAIASLTTTSYGRAFLALANQAALMALVQAATTSIQGKVALATSAEGEAGSVATKASTPASTTAQVNAMVPSASETAQGKVELATLAEAATGTDSQRAVTPAALGALKAAVKEEILGAGVPEALDTLDELAAALGDDPDFAATITTQLAGKQPIDADLTAIAALSSAADKVPYSTGAGTWALADFTTPGRTLVGAANVGAQRTALGVYSEVEIGDVNEDFVAIFEAGLA